MESAQLFSSINLLINNEHTPEDVKANLVEFVKSWVESGLYKEDLKNPEVQKELLVIESYCLENEKKDLAKQIQLAIPKPKSLSPSEITVQKENTPEQDDAVRKWMKAKISYGTKENVREFAEALTLAEATSFNDLSIDDIKSNKIREGKTEQGKFVAYTDQFNHLSSKVVDQILYAETPEERKNAYVFFTHLALECCSQNNFNSGMAIFAGLNNSNISHMKNRNLIGNKNTQKNLADLEKIFSSDNNYSNLNKLTRQSVEDGHPVIPYAGIMNNELTFISDGNPNEKNDGINVTKLNIYSKVIGGFIAAKKTNESLNDKKNENSNQLREFLMRQAGSSEDEKYKKYQDIKNASEK